MYIYVLRSLSNPDRYYTGMTENPKRRLREHNSGDSWATRQSRPWELIVVLGFAHPEAADSFEEYLKSGSGRAFSKRHFW